MNKLDWLTLDSAPRDGSPVLLKMREKLPSRLDGFEGIQFVGRWGGYMHWGFAAPVGVGGFNDELIEGWMPLPGK